MMLMVMNDVIYDDNVDCNINVNGVNDNGAW